MTQPSPTRSVHDALGYERTTLDALFAPKTIAVIGASEQAGSEGLGVLRNLKQGRAQIYAVNPHHAQVDGMTAYPDISAIPVAIDLAVVVTPAETVPSIIAACVEANVKAAIVISAGFKERGATGAALEQATLNHARRGHLRVLGPNCLGIISGDLFGTRYCFPHSRRTMSPMRGWRSNSYSMMFARTVVSSSPKKKRFNCWRRIVLQRKVSHSRKASQSRLAVG